MMEKLYPIVPLSNGSNALELSTRFDKNRGYIISLTPIKLEPHGRAYIYDPDYYQKYRTLEFVYERCNRQSAKRAAAADAFAIEQSAAIIQKYIDAVRELCGETIKLMED